MKRGLGWKSDEFDFDLFERAADAVAGQLAFFRTEDFEAQPTDNEKLLAGHLIGGLYAKGFIKSPPQ